MAEPNRNTDASPSSAEAALRKRKREATVTVTDEEVEKFCAILRRMRRPVKYFGDVGGGIKRWRPSFMAADFNGVDGEENGKDKAKVGDGGCKCLDLNMDPLTE